LKNLMQKRRRNTLRSATFGAAASFSEPVKESLAPLASQPFACAPKKSIGYAVRERRSVLYEDVNMREIANEPLGQLELTGISG
jgi:hypothetical protein